MPHISARRLASASDLDRVLAGLKHNADVRQVFVVADDPRQPLTPSADPLAIIHSGLLGRTASSASAFCRPLRRAPPPPICL